VYKLSSFHCMCQRPHTACSEAIHCACGRGWIQELMPPGEVLTLEVQRWS
jgi:hypothetical protein